MAGFDPDAYLATPPKAFDPDEYLRSLPPIVVTPESMTVGELPGPRREYSAFEVPVQMIKNVPSSAMRFAGGLYDVITNPVQTAKGVLDIGAGAIQGQRKRPRQTQSQTPSRSQQTMTRWTPSHRSPAMSSSEGGSVSGRWPRHHFDLTSARSVRV